MKTRPLFALAIALIVALSGFLAIPIPRARAATDSFTLFGDSTKGWGASNTTITSPGPPLSVNFGDTVSIKLVSSDGITHIFYIDWNDNGAKDATENASTPFGGVGHPTTVWFNFTVTETGTHRYYCSIHPGTMFGSFAIQGGIPAPDYTIYIIVIVVIVVVAVAVTVALRRRPKTPASSTQEPPKTP
jgi:heme/copper-type cytochrome/quinol oxidase subunit 2